MTDAPSQRHRLEGLEPDNLLAFLALLGLLRALEAADQMLGEAAPPLCPRAAWDLDHAPLRPVIEVRTPVTRQDLLTRAAQGLNQLVPGPISSRADLNFPRSEARSLLEQAALTATAANRKLADILACLMSDAATRDVKGKAEEPIDPTPLCLLFGQGHQHFLQRFIAIPAMMVPPPRQEKRKTVAISAGECLGEALFAPWHRRDKSFSFRWDPDEDVRYALMAGDPSKDAYKAGTQHGANRLAAVGLTALPVAPQLRSGRPRAAIPGGRHERDGFSFAWPIWRAPASLSTIRGLLSHPDLRTPGALDHLGVDQVLIARRISVAKFLNFTRARPIEEAPHRTAT